MIRPVVEISDGLRLDDVTAGRLVEQMLVALAIDHAAAERMLDALADRVHAGIMGNVVGQQRFFARLKKALGKTLLTATLVPKSGMHFRLVFDAWRPAQVGGAPLMEAARAGWLVGHGTLVMGGGRGKGFKVFRQVLCALTRHALVRLVQRGGCRTPEDLVALLKRAWGVLLIALATSDKGKWLPKDEEAGWIVPVDDLFLVLCSGGSGQLGVVTTVLGRDMIIERARLEDLRAMLTDPNLRVTDPCLRAAFQATAGATRRGRRT